MHALQEIHLVVGKYVFLLQDPVEAVAIDRVIGRFVIYEDATFILMFIEWFETLCKQENVYACTHACHKPSLVAVEASGEIVLQLRQETSLEPLEHWA